MFDELFTQILEDNPFITTGIEAIGYLLFFFAIALVTWVYRDARRRCNTIMSSLWGVLAIAALVLGIIVGFANNAMGFIAVGGASLAAVLAVLMVYTFARPADFKVDAQERDLSQRLLEAELETHACPSCGAGIETDFQICPSCNVTLRRPCDCCGRPIKVGWATCPYCRARKGQEETRASSGKKKSGGGSGSGGRSRSGSPSGSSTQKRSAKRDSDGDQDQDYDTPKSGSSPKRSSGSSSRSSSGGRRSSGSGSSGSSTFKD
jgi:uncharacterized membrane protein YgcG